MTGALEFHSSTPEIYVTIYSKKTVGTALIL